MSLFPELSLIEPTWNAVNVRAIQLFRAERPGLSWTGGGVSRSWWRRRARKELIKELNPDG